MRDQHALRLIDPGGRPQGRPSSFRLSDAETVATNRYARTAIPGRSDSGDLRAHLERQFLRGMSWDNYGDWHVDHILPVASFDFASADDPAFKACWALTNLRPLWARDNLAKSDKRLLLI